MPDSLQEPPVSHVHVALEGRVLRLTLARPEKKNALTRGMYTALADTLDEAAADPAVRVVLLHGEGGTFTAGNDLGDFLSDPPRDETSPVFRFLRTVRDFPKPLLAAVEGHAVGIGTTLLLHCDLAYAAPTARFQLPFVNLGLVPEAASSLLLPLAVGPQRAAAWLLFGEPFSADEAVQAGLIAAVVPAGALLDHAMARARALAERPPAAVRLTKALLRRAGAGSVAEAMEVEAGHFVERLAAPEAQEALAAFLEKRLPDFSRFD
ncbi:MAG TPA: enoyl-CoA hydratase [Rubricoccaceae bacterium]|nr:enoyl-CoA hydratase [Rubricoccaceae bacterium]